MGSRGLGAKGLNGSNAWKLNNENAINYGITLKDKKQYATLDPDEKIRQLNESLATINIMNNQLLGLTTRNVPELVLNYGVNAKDKNEMGFCTYNKFSGEISITLNVASFGKSPDTAAHEYIHALCNFWYNSHYKDFGERANAYDDSLLERSITQNALIRIGALKEGEKDSMDKYFPAWQKYAGTIHRFSGDSYALKNIKETVTTSVQMVMRYGDKASPYAKAIVAELRKEMKSLQRRVSNQRRTDRKLDKEYEEWRRRNTHTPIPKQKLKKARTKKAK